MAQAQEGTGPRSVSPGTYTEIDSDPATWSQNAGSGGAGMAWADGCYR